MSTQNYEFIEGSAVNIKAWTKNLPIESMAIDQLKNIASLPFIHSHVAVMPDVHVGKGATVGSVIPTNKAIIPAAVGVDIGCGMIAVKTSLTANDLPDNLLNIRLSIESSVPHGRTNNGGAGDRGAWGDVPDDIQFIAMMSLHEDLCELVHKHDGLNSASKRYQNHLGTLGTGNHFIEICLDESDNVWIMLHSGSRGIGNRIGSYFIEKAKLEMEKWYIHLPDTDLAYLSEGSEYFDDYITALDWAQRYAKLNREIMMKNVITAMKSCIPKSFDTDIMAINCHHNYVSKERHFGKNVYVTRKGAVSAQKDQYGIIPGSMGAKSFIVRGLGNRESFCSCSHGAGRRMSRTEARNKFTLDDHIHATEGVECRKDIDVIDETPLAYKDIDIVMAAQSDLVEIVHTLKQVLCVKG